MIIKIDSSSSVPVYAQIVEQVKRAIASGALQKGDSLPSLRETALNLRINPLTVGKAYRELESEGLIETRHGLGSFVTADSSDSTDGFRKDLLARAIDALLLDARNLGIPFDELQDLISARVKAADDLSTTDGSKGGSKDDK